MKLIDARQAAAPEVIDLTGAPTTAVPDGEIELRAKVSFQ